MRMTSKKAAKRGTNYMILKHSRSKRERKGEANRQREKDVVRYVYRECVREYIKRHVFISEISVREREEERERKKQIDECF